MATKQRKPSNLNKLRISKIQPRIKASSDLPKRSEGNINDRNKDFNESDYLPWITYFAIMLGCAVAFLGGAS
jgi:hypothetical protein